MASLGLVSDPDFPSHIAGSLGGDLPGLLDEQFDEESEWSVDVVRDPVAAGRSSGKEILDATERQRKLHGWDYAVAVTDLPLRKSGHPVLADIGSEHERVGVISLPSLGGLQPQRRARQLLISVLGELNGSERTDSGLQSGTTELLGPIRREGADSEAIAVRYRSTRRRGKLRLLSGMVRSNTPWRLVLGMSGALAAALGTSIFMLTSSTIWQMADMLGPWRRGVVLVVSVTVMTGWLIITHSLWEKPRYTADREQRMLYNSSTILTIMIGVGCLYVVLFAFNLAASLFLIDPELLSSTLGGTAGISNYLGLTWLVTSMGVTAGALGSGLEDDATVRRAAYGYREAQRRANQQQAEQRDQDG
ncbi:hypothetical protein J2S53_003934 [Actinopolyspora lacussalsi]|nr:hypothetical protein [Actinopolyspora lacussalsi]